MLYAAFDSHVKCHESQRGEQNVPMMVVAAKVAAETAVQVPRVQNVIATVANMCCGMVHRQAYT